MSRRLATLPALVAAQSAPAQGAGTKVTMRNIAFEPATLTVKLGSVHPGMEGTLTVE